MFLAGAVGVLLTSVLPTTWLAVSPLLSAIAFGLQPSLTSLMYVGFLLLALSGGLVTRVCDNGSLRWTGKYSYGLYVLHLPLFSYLQAPVHEWLEHTLGERKALLVVLTGLICFAVSIVAAYASYNLYERRFLRLKRFFDYAKPVAKTVDRGERSRIHEGSPVS
jgi:peptidoglycan/LPS O-acetylase OafA/YrhL